MEEKKRIESVWNLNETEKKLISQCALGKKIPYIQYVCHILTERELLYVKTKMYELERNYPILRSFFARRDDDIYRKYTLSQRGYSVLAHDISDYDDLEQREMVNQICAAEMRRYYIPEQTFMLRLHILKEDKEKFFVILSVSAVLENFLSTEMIIRELFPRKYIQNAGERSKQVRTKEEVYDYFSKTLYPLPAPYEKIENHTDFVIEKEKFELDEELKEILTEYKRLGDDKLKAICCNAFAVLTQKTLGRENVILGVHQKLKKMDVLPVKVGKTNGFAESFMLIQDQLKKADEYDCCTVLELQKQLNFNFHSTIPVVVEFAEKLITDAQWALMDEKHLWRLAGESFDNYSMRIFFELYGNMPAITYEYDKKTFCNVSVKSIHENFENILKFILRKDAKPEDVYTKIEQGQDINEKRRKLQMAQMLKECSLFSGFDDRLLQQVANGCSLLTLSEEDTVIENGMDVNSLYFVAEGSVSMEGTRKDDYSVPLLLVKKGEVFGIEAFTTSRVSNNGYKVIKKNTTLIEIPILALANVMEEHYEILGELFEIMNTRLLKFERLWMME